MKWIFKLPDLSIKLSFKKAIYCSTGMSIAWMFFLVVDDRGGCGGSSIVTENLSLRVYLTSKLANFNNFSVIMIERIRTFV